MQETEHRTLGIALVCVAIFLFACQDALAKYLFESYPVAFVQAVRFSVLLALTLAVFLPRCGAGLFKTNDSRLVILRGLALTSSSLLGGLALSRMPLAECTGIFYLSPFVLLFLSQALLREEIGWIGWAATLLGFSGLLVTLRPSAHLPMAGVGLALASMVVGAGYPLLSRLLAKSERPQTLMFYLAATGVAFFGAQLPWSWPAGPVQNSALALMIAYGAISYLGHTLFTYAYRFAQVAVLTPFTYLHVGWATILGTMVFKDELDWVTIFGLAVIAAAGAVNAALNKRRPTLQPSRSA